MRMLYLIRGVPGAGKSTLAQQLARNANYAADDFFTRDGVYQFDPTQLKEAHHWCREMVYVCMTDPIIGSSIIAVANTFTQKWEMQVYYDLAREHGYLVVELTIKPDLTPAQLAARNIHGVSVEVIERMLNRWEA